MAAGYASSALTNYQTSTSPSYSSPGPAMPEHSSGISPSPTATVTSTAASQFYHHHQGPPGPPPVMSSQHCGVAPGLSVASGLAVGSGLGVGAGLGVGVGGHHQPSAWTRPHSQGTSKPAEVANSWPDNYR